MGEDASRQCCRFIKDGVLFCCDAGEDDVYAMSRKWPGRYLKLLMPLRASDCVDFIFVRLGFVMQHRRHNNLSSDYLIEASGSRALGPTRLVQSCSPQ